MEQLIRPTGIIDPCANVLQSDTTALATACKSYPGVVANMAANQRNSLPML